MTGRGFLHYRFIMMILPRMAAYLWVLGFVLSLGFGIFPAAEFERLAAVLCALAGAGILCLHGGALAQRVILAPVLSAIILALWLLVMISSVWSVSPATTLIYGGMFSVMPASFLALMFSREADRALFLRLVLIFGGVAVAGLSLWAMVQVFILPEYLVSGQVRHPFANPNAYAGMLTLCLLIGTGFYMQASGLKTRLLLLGAICLMGVALAAIASQAATLTLIGGMMTGLLLSARQLSAKKILPLLAVLVIVMDVGMVMAALPDKKDIVTRLSALAGGDTRTWDNRVDIWKATLALIAQHPVLGTGYKTFFLTYPAVRLPAEVYSGGYMVHSDPLQFWAEIGIAGVLLFYAAGILALMRFIRWYRGGGRDAATLFLFAGCMAFIVHTHVDFLLYTMPSMMVFAVAFAALVIRTQTSDEKTAVPLSFAVGLPPQAQPILVLLPVGFILFFFVPLMISEYYTARASRMIFQDDVSGFAQTVNAANRIGMGLNARPYTMAVTVPLSILKARYPLIPPDEQGRLFRQTDALISAGLRQNALNPAMYLHRADLVRYVSPAIVPKDYPTAEESLRKALAINPLHVPSRLALAEILLARGEKDQALDVLAAGLGWPYPNFQPQAYFDQTIQLANAMGKPELAAEAENKRDTHNRRVEAAQRRYAALQNIKDDSLFLP